MTQAVDRNTTTHSNNSPDDVIEISETVIKRSPGFTKLVAAGSISAAVSSPIAADAPAIIRNPTPLTYAENTAAISASINIKGCVNRVVQTIKMIKPVNAARGSITRKLLLLYWTVESLASRFSAFKIHDCRYSTAEGGFICAGSASHSGSGIFFAFSEDKFTNSQSQS